MTADPTLLDWLLDADPALRWQVERDLAGAPREVWDATRDRIATEGFGPRLLALQDPDGQWAGGSFFPNDFDFRGPEAAKDAGQPWIATTWTLNTLRDWGLDAATLAGTAELLATNSRWEYNDLPYWGGEVDCCINAYTLANGAWRTSPESARRAVGDAVRVPVPLVLQRAQRVRLLPVRRAARRHGANGHLRPG